MIVEIISRFVRSAKRQLVYIRRVFRQVDRMSTVVDGAKYFLPEKYCSRKEVGFDDHSEISTTEVLWQPDVYQMAELLARKFKAKYILDVGCGHAEKLAMFIGKYEVIGIDTIENTEWCQANYSSGTWLSVDLNSDFPVLPADAIGNTVLICSDVIEHIYDVGPFTENIGNILKQCHMGVISTPDRNQLYPLSNLGPPINPCHVREWSALEFKQFLESKGIEAWVGLTRTNTTVNEMNTVMAIVSA